ncbi:hypothetical protein IEL92_000273 [Salmonella enterica]|nr:hypothetical protein [Salmonella enterica]EGH5214807.1 hypothetical protein [Salmonella enterica]EHH6212152.1 hypothetical protein [Salmonella enterica]
MEIRSAVVLRVAKEIAWIKNNARALSPLEYEKRFVDIGRAKGYIYIGMVGEYKGALTKALMKCKDHGYFTTIFNNFQTKAGCPKCGLASRAGKRRTTEDEALKKANEQAASNGRGEVVKGFDGGYKNVSYRNLIVVCRNHGEYSVSLNNYARGQGCRECAYEGRANKFKISEDEALKKATTRAIENNKGESITGFDDGYYNMVARNLVVLCPIHGEYKTSLNDYLNGHGCSHCGGGGYSKEIPGVLYIQELRIGKQVVGAKFGITNKTAEQRMQQQSSKSKLQHTLVFSHRFEDGRKPLAIEKMIKQSFKRHIGAVPREIMPDGFTETLPIELLPVVLANVKSLCLTLS